MEYDIIRVKLITYYIGKDIDMYYYINGEYVFKGDNFVVIDCGGIGYKIYTSALAMTAMPPIGEKVKMYTHFYVREDIQDLYGFPENDELSMFLNLISVSGVGPKAALSILSVAKPSDIILAIMQKNIKIITKASGVGPKLAERVILELKNKIKNIDVIPEEYSGVEINDNSSEAVSALMALGYSEQEAKKAVSSVEGDAPLEDIVRESLKMLMK